MAKRYTSSEWCSGRLELGSLNYSNHQIWQLENPTELYFHHPKGTLFAGSFCRISSSKLEGSAAQGRLEMGSKYTRCGGLLVSLPSHYLSSHLNESDVFALLGHADALELSSERPIVCEYDFSRIAVFAPRHATPVSLCAVFRLPLLATDADTLAVSDGEQRIREAIHADQQLRDHVLLKPFVMHSDLVCESIVFEDLEVEWDGQCTLDGLVPRPTPREIASMVRSDKARALT